MHLSILKEIPYNEQLRRFFIACIIVCVIFLFISDIIFNPDITLKSIKRTLKNFSLRRLLYKIFGGLGL